MAFLKMNDVRRPAKTVNKKQYNFCGFFRPLTFLVSNAFDFQFVLLFYCFCCPVICRKMFNTDIQMLDSFDLTAEFELEFHWADFIYGVYMNTFLLVSCSLLTFTTNENIDDSIS